MKDKDFLIWIHERLEHKYNESPLMDYMHKLRAIILATPEDQETKNIDTNPTEFYRNVLHRHEQSS